MQIIYGLVGVVMGVSFDIAAFVWDSFNLTEHLQQLGQRFFRFILFLLAFFTF